MMTRLTLAVAAVGLAATSAVAINAQSGAPTPPTLTANVAASLVSLVWTIPAGPPPARFEIHAGSGPGLSNIAIVAVPASTSTFSAAAPPGTYFVRILVFSASGASAASNEVAVVVGGSGACAVPGAPTNLVVIPASATVTLGWNAPLTGGAPSGYSLLVGSTSGAVNLGMIAVGLTTTITAPSPIGSYFIRVVATNACGNSPPSAEVSFAVPPQGVSVPVGTYAGTVFNYSPPGGALTSFTLQLNEPLASPAPLGSPVPPISARWTDNRGCVKTTDFIGEASRSGGAYITLFNFACNGELFFALRFRAVNGNVYSGDCGTGASGCTFQMIRQ
jgi:hypothetical protein